MTKMPYPFKTRQGGRKPKIIYWKKWENSIIFGSLSQSSSLFICIICEIYLQLFQKSSQEIQLHIILHGFVKKLKLVSWNFNVQQHDLDQDIHNLCNMLSLHHLHNSLHHPIHIRNCCFHHHTNYHLSSEDCHMY